MKNIRVNLNEKSYDVTVGKDILQKSGEIFNLERKVVIVTDSGVPKTYAETIAKGIRTGAFTYVAHPDMFNFTGDKTAYSEQVRKIAIASRECNVPLEINFLGIRDNRIYPNEEFWKVVGEEKAPVTFGFDAHDVQSAYDGESYPKAMELVKAKAVAK